jgi:hypothetical protein
MATYNKFNTFMYDMASGYHKLQAADDVLKVYLAATATAPNAESDAVKADITEFAGGTGYTAGGIDITNTLSRATTVTTLATNAGFDPVWTAGAGDWNAFQFVVLYNSSHTTPGPNLPLIAWWDYGQSLTLGNGETFTVDFGASVFTLA